ncbi:MAG: 2,3,4,5-tetrahydropyridine-2,6-dicarboxylate N-succinyltransferase, partial [Oxalobacteraceae bacterium]|nr:2,3,4,5-tetrahydropyridine-2,6-dicarboxylate N-succinyltransferase [Oxalobacteraceae bacterium]
MTQSLQSLIDSAWEERANFSPKSAPADVKNAVAEVLEQLNQGVVRVAQKDSGSWVVNQWIKKAVLLSFRLEDKVAIPGGGGMQFYDKVPTKFANWSAADFASAGFR